MATVYKAILDKKSLAGFLNGKKGAALELLLAAGIVFFFIFPTVIILLAGLISLRLRGTRWKEVGFSMPANPVLTVVAGIIISIATFFIGNLILVPLVLPLTNNAYDTSLFSSIEGNLGQLALWLAIVWVFGGFIEELGFRGYLLNRATDLFGRHSAGWATSILLVSVLFGILHLYQGLSGVVLTAFTGLCAGLCYYFSGRNLSLPIIVHGTVDSIAIFCVFLGLGH